MESKVSKAVGTNGGLVIKLQAAQVAGLVLGLTGGAWSVTSTNSRIAETQATIGEMSGQLAQIQSRMAAEEASRLQRVTDQAIAQANASTERASMTAEIARLHSRVTTLETCIRAPRSCPLK